MSMSWLVCWCTQAPLMAVTITPLSKREMAQLGGGCNLMTHMLESSIRHSLAKNASEGTKMRTGTRAQETVDSQTISLQEGTPLKDVEMPIFYSMKECNP